jgi:GntR family transcriptional regulator, carbon starvation induced regulator
VDVESRTQAKQIRQPSDTQPKTTQARNVYEQIRSDILACRIPPGEKLRINALVDRFESSLGSVREALSKLSSEGLVYATDQKGYSVAPVSRDELLDLTETRIELEIICLQRSIEFGDVDWESRVVAAFHRLNRLTERNPQDPARLDDAWGVAHAEFHEALVAACGSAVKLRIRKALYEQSERYRRLSVPLRTVARDVNAEHKAIVDAVLKRDAVAAARQISAHLQKTTDILLNSAVLS